MFVDQNCEWDPRQSYYITYTWPSVRPQRCIWRKNGQFYKQLHDKRHIELLYTLTLRPNNVFCVEYKGVRENTLSQSHSRLSSSISTRALTPELKQNICSASSTFPHLRKHNTISTRNLYNSFFIPTRIVSHRCLLRALTFSVRVERRLEIGN